MDAGQLADLDREVRNLLEKEGQRYKIASEAAEIEQQVIKDKIFADEQQNTLKVKECDVRYQENQHAALKNELDRATTYYDQVLQEVRNKADIERQGLDDLENELRQYEQEREDLRQEVNSLRHEVNEKRDYRPEDSEADLDSLIRAKLTQVEEAEEKRRHAQVELDSMYDVWRDNLDKALYDAQAQLSTNEDQAQISQIKKLIVENDKLARKVNSLFQDKEELENQIYIESTKNKISESLDIDISNINQKLLDI